MLRLTILLLGVILVVMAVAGRAPGPDADSPQGAPALRAEAPQPAAAPGDLPPDAALQPGPDGLLNSPALPPPAAVSAPAPEGEVAKSDAATPDGEVEKAPPVFGSVEDEITAALLGAGVGADPPQDPTPDLRYVTAERVNLRSGPSTGFEAVAQLDRGAAVRLLGEPEDGWAHITVLDASGADGISGYVAARYLAETQP